MELKKAESVDLQGKKTIFAQIGVVLSLLIVYGMFSVHTSDIEIDIPLAEEEEVIAELPPVTRPEEPPKPKVQKVVAPSITDKIEVVENEIEVEDTELFNPETDEFTPNFAGLPQGDPNDGELLDDATPVFKAEVDPKFDGKDVNYFSTWVKQRVKYPQVVQDAGISGAVTLRYVIGADGKIRDIQVLSSPDQMLTDEVIRVINSSPAWSPAMQRNRPVPIYSTIRVVYTL